jgi:hypothetical protein
MERTGDLQIVDLDLASTDSRPRIMPSICEGLMTLPIDRAE